MLRKINAHQHYISSGTGHQGRFHFPYGEYQDSLKGPFGVLQALNDFQVDPEQGFDTHPHDEIEIISYCVEGELQHQDSLGHNTILRSGGIGYQCAGSGITHSEKNASPDTQLRFIQLLIQPTQSKLRPQYQANPVPHSIIRNQWSHLVSGRNNRGSLRIQQDVDILVCQMDPGVQMTVAAEAKRQRYIVCLQGQAMINQIDITDHCAIRATGDEKLLIDCLETAHLMMVDVSKTIWK
jgi:quercetin 2,3-dioxygenase